MTIVHPSKPLCAIAVAALLLTVPGIRTAVIAFVMQANRTAYEVSKLKLDAYRALFHRDGEPADAPQQPR